MQLHIYVKCQSVFKVNNMQSRKGFYVDDDEMTLIILFKRKKCFEMKMIKILLDKEEERVLSEVSE